MHLLDQLSLITKQLSFYRNSDDDLQCDFHIDQSTLDLFTRAEDAGFEFSYKVEGVFLERSELTSRSDRPCKAAITSNTSLIFLNWKEFLSYRPNLTKVPSNFLLIQENVCFPRDCNNQQVKHYLEICDFINILINESDHSDSLAKNVTSNVVFLHKSRLEIPTIYTEIHLQDSLDGISVIKSLLVDESHTDQKTSILKEVLHGLLINIKKEERLNYLLLNFGEFSRRVNENYQLFVSEFSFDDVRREYEEKQRDYFSKLNDVFSSAQTKMLGVPISLALASFKMSSITDSETFWTNLFLLFAVYVYSAMMSMLINNQKHTLCAIKSEYKSQMTRLRHEYAEQYDKIKEIEQKLDERYSFQNSCLNWFRVFTVGLLVIVTGLFLSILPWKLILGI